MTKRGSVVVAVGVVDGISAYGIGSAVDARGRRYWVLELGH